MAQETIQFPDNFPDKANPDYRDVVLGYDSHSGQPISIRLETLQANSATNIIGVAHPSDSPTGDEVNGQGYDVSNTKAVPDPDDGSNDDTYTNFLTNVSDGSGGFLPVVVPASTSGVIRKSGGSWEFVPNAVDVSGLVPKTDIVDNVTTSATDKPLSAEQGKILNDKVTSFTEPKDWFKDPNCVKGFMQNSDFTFVPSDNWLTTPFIPVKPGDIVKYKGMASTAMICVGAYTAADNASYVPGTGRLLSGQSGQVAETDVTIPNNGALYIRMCTQINVGGSWSAKSPNNLAVSDLKLYLPRTEQVIKSASYTQDVSKIIQLFDATTAVEQNTDTTGFIQDRYVSNSDGHLGIAAGYRTTNIPITDETQTEIAISGRINATTKYYRFADASGNTLSFGSVVGLSQILTIPSGAKLYQETYLNYGIGDPVTAGDGIMVNYGDKALPFTAYNITYLNNQPISAAKVSPGATASTPQNPLEIANKEYVDSVVGNPKIAINKSVRWIGDSLTARQTLPENKGGYVSVVQQKYTFSESIISGYSGYTLTVASGINSILGARSDWGGTICDIHTLLIGTNDFRLAMPLGTVDDYKNATGWNTFYGALRYFIDYIYSLNPVSKLMLITPPQRNNGSWDNGGTEVPYDSRHPNEIGFYLDDYCDAIRFAAEYEGLVIVDLYRYGGFNLVTVNPDLGLTIDGLHPTWEGYKVIGAPIRQGCDRLLSYAE